MNGNSALWERVTDVDSGAVSGLACNLSTVRPSYLRLERL